MSIEFTIPQGAQSINPRNIFQAKNEVIRTSTCEEDAVITPSQCYQLNRAWNEFRQYSLENRYNTSRLDRFQ